jgi:hypothetical protein
MHYVTFVVEPYLSSPYIPLPSSMFSVCKDVKCHSIQPSSSLRVVLQIPMSSMCSTECDYM